jgi:CheY-like chemotaxis protein
MVLIVEEDQDVGFIIETMLRFNGFEVARATSASEAILLAAKRCPDIVVTELELQDTVPAELCKTIRQYAAAGSIPFIGFTSDPEDLDRDGCRGIDQIIRKPNFHHLVGTVLSLDIEAAPTA